MRIWDISRPLRNGMDCWPGDQPFAAAWTATIGPDCPVNIGEIRLSTHTGTHLDAPLHYDPAGADIARLPLERLIGPAQLLDVSAAGALVGIADLAGRLEGVERLLLRTRRGPWPRGWDPAFTAIDPAAMRHLAEAGIRLVGIDTPSVDPADSTALEAHMVARSSGMLLLEGLDLLGVPEDVHELLALPLRLDGMDASPVRAVLRALGPQS